MKTIKLANHVHLHLHNSTKFNDITLSVRFINHLDDINRVARSYLVQLLSDSCKMYPTKESVTKQLDFLYGSNFKVTSDIMGNTECIEFRISTVNGKLVGENLLEKQIHFLFEFILNPKLVDEQFDQNTFNEMRERLLLTIQSIHDQPGSHANDQSKRTFSPKLARKALISEDQVNNCHNEDVYIAYNQMIQNDQIDIQMLGNFNENEVIEIIQNKVHFNDRNLDLNPLDLTIKNECTEVIETKAINQSRVVITFTTNQTLLDKTYPALLIANGIFGGLPSSYLFQEVREKRSLCYSISSRLDNFDGLMSVQTAIDGNNYHVVKDCVLEQFNRIKSGDFSEEILETTKKMMINILSSSQDSQKSILMFDYRTYLFNETLGIDHVISEIQRCTKEDIVNAFIPIECKHYYCLMQEALNENN